MNLCTIITPDWVDKHLIRWLRYAKKNVPGERFLYYLGPARNHSFPWLKDEFKTIIDLPHEGRDQYNFIRMGATEDFGVKEICYCDADADIIAPIDELEVEVKEDIAFVPSPSIHSEWTRLCIKNKWNWLDWEANNGFLYMKRDFRNEYAEAKKELEGQVEKPRISGTMTFNLMVRRIGKATVLPYNFGVIWWDATGLLGAKVVQYCNDKGQQKHIMLEEIWRNAHCD